jgi:hypothetical protein
MEGIFNKKTKGMTFKGKDTVRSKIVIINNIMQQTNKQTLSVVSFREDSVNSVFIEGSIL